MVRGSLPLPESIGRFRVQALLGRGGMGEVYKAFDPTLQRTVAVKTIRPDIDRPEYLERLMREAQACARLSHSNIVTIFEAGRADGVVFIAMEFLEGRNLAETLHANPPTYDVSLRILIQVLDALQHAHTHGVIHRDIKPSNIHITADGAIKLVDFGLARVLTAETLTASGSVLGTPHYASPEQLKGETVDRRTDLYSVGVMAYEMLSGRRPFEPDNETISSVIIKVINEPAKPMDTGMSRMLPDIEDIVSKALAKSPHDRYQSADEMRRALAAFLDSSRERLTAMESAAGVTRIVPSTVTNHDSVATHISAREPAPTNRWMWAGGAAAAAVLIGVALVGLPSTNAEPSAIAVSTPPAAAKPSETAGSNPPAADAGSSAAPVERGAVPAAAVKTAATPKNSEGTPPIAKAPIESAPVPRDLNARDMFESSAANAAAAAPGIRFRLMLEGTDGKSVDVDPARDFHTGERIRFAFESNIDGYLYVAQQGTSGNWTVLFPNPDIAGGRNAVKRFEEYVVPDDNWFQLQGNPGEEHVFVFLSREPMKTLPGFDRPVTTFERSSPALVAELQSQIASRDLILAKDSGAAKGQRATYVVNKAELGKAVTAKFTINHKP